MGDKMSKVQWIEGWREKLFANGYRPCLEWPPSKLPDAGDRVMEVRTCWQPKPAETDPPKAEANGD